MKTYNYIEKNGNAVLTLSAENEDEAGEYFESIVKHPRDFRMEIVDNDEDSCVDYHNLG